MSQSALLKLIAIFISFLAFCEASFASNRTALIYVNGNKLPRPKGRGIRRFASQLPEVAKPQERRKRRGMYPQ